MIVTEIIFDTLYFKICSRKTEKNAAIELFLHASQNITLACSVYYDGKQHLVPQKARPHD